MIGSTRRLCLAAAIALGAAAAPAAGQGTPPVRPARLAALSSPLVDADLEWIVPLLSAEAADMRRDRVRTGAAVAALQEAVSADAGAARVQRIRSGQGNALDELRGFSPQAVVPPSARYDAGCSAGVTEGIAGLFPMGAFVIPRAADARDFYRRAGFEVLGDASTGFVGRSPDRRITVSFGSSAHDVRKLARMPRYPHLRACAALPDAGAMLVVGADVQLQSAASAAGDAAVQGSAERLPDALRRAGLTAEQWNALVILLWEAATDEMFAANPAALDAAAGSPAAGDRRRANLRWFQRNRPVIEPALSEASDTGR